MQKPGAMTDVPWQDSRDNGRQLTLNIHGLKETRVQYWGDLELRVKRSRGQLIMIRCGCGAGFGASKSGELGPDFANLGGCGRKHCESRSLPSPRQSMLNNIQFLPRPSLSLISDYRWKLVLESELLGRHEHHDVYCTLRIR